QPPFLLSEDQFQCSICRDVFTEPVSTPCGHNFCKACISGYWDTTSLCQCPMWVCDKHNTHLELFCRTDQMCVCQFCTETDHKTHHIVHLEEECGERKAQLEKTEAQVQQMIQERMQKGWEIKHSVELSKRDAEREITDSMQVFTDLVRSIERSQLVEMLTVIEHLLNIYKPSTWDNPNKLLPAAFKINVPAFAEITFGKRCVCRLNRKLPLKATLSTTRDRI
uniref:E3 ubiquitin-protein ligase TRIM39-like n=1 Tax=Salmo trutta TaxID=8032 RepID=A0A674E5B3_SALTR